MTDHCLPRVFGYRDKFKRNCGHCGCPSWFFMFTVLGSVFCGCCFRWCEYHDEPREWGDGMWA